MKEGDSACDTHPGYPDVMRVVNVNPSLRTWGIPACESPMQ
jgi:hypothetical protein